MSDARNVLGTPLQGCSEAHPVILEATRIRALQVTTLADLEYHGLRAKELPGA